MAEFSPLSPERIAELTGKPIADITKNSSVGLASFRSEPVQAPVATDSRPAFPVFSPAVLSEINVEPGGWDELNLPPELDTPWKRFRAVTNIVQNGAQSLGVLSMRPYVKYWESPTSINARLNSKSEKKVVTKDTTRAHLMYCIQPVGAAAQSDIDDRDWSLTTFGVAVRPAIIYTWQKMLAMNVDGMNIFGTKSLVTKDENGEILSSPTEVRTKILLHCFGKQSVQAKDLDEVTGGKGIYEHVLQLAAHGFLDKESAHVSSGRSATEYEYTEQGRNISSWLEDTDRLMSVKKGIEECIKTGKNVTAANVIETIIKQDAHLYKDHTSARLAAYRGLSTFVKDGFLRPSKFHAGKFSEIKLTSSGEQVVKEVLIPLLRWTVNRWEVKDIVAIQRKLQPNPDAYQYLYGSIADSFIKTSPHKRDPEETRRIVKEFLAVQKEQVTISDVASRVNLSKATTSGFIDALVIDGLVETNIEGNTVFVSLKKGSSE